MATVSKKIADQIIANDGVYPGDPRASRVVEYDNQWGGHDYAVIWPHEDQRRYHTSPACMNVKVIWEADGRG